MLTMLLVIVATLTIFGLVKLRSGKKTRKHYFKNLSSNERNTTNQSIEGHRFHCVSIVNKGHCCEQVNAITGKRFLSKEAPAIPMEECTMPHCECRYQHFEDRRQSSNERRVDYGVTRELFGVFGEQNRRDRSKGRRTTDN
ncbi:hypothetical protein [Shewanella sp. HN-41]|uniref:hypothetical protein n=1 Tax=Shewanella sp. HN-41 TaxID=327275 RepID=UPI0002125D74|nr:hypothetical protein [Shewanella sp. HN-41]EGM71696.1 hypothetical protein SOHN41_00297 [Shewanella sp. HN-41]